MQTHLADDDVTLRVPLRVNGEPVVPDNNSVTFTVRDNAGQVVVNKEPVVMAVASSEATVVIDAVHNALAGASFGNRTVIVEFTKTGRPMRTQIAYRLTAWLNTTVDVDAVRNFIGVDRGELPDEAIDIVDAYLDVELTVGATALAAALATAGPDQRAANNLILAQAVLKQLPGLPMRLSQSESNGVFSATRAKIDFDKLADAANSLYADNLGLIVVAFDAGQDLLIAPALSPDPITGG